MSATASTIPNITFDFRFIIRAVIHKDYLPPTPVTNQLPQGPDIALLKMDKSVPRDLKSAPICLPAGYMFPDTPLSGNKFC